MEYVVVGAASFLASGLVLFSGFGLSTILTPILAVFIPVPAAIAAAAVIHLLNNIFKIFLVGRSADRKSVILFAVPAIFAAAAGALLLNYFSNVSAIAAYRIGDTLYEVTPVKLVVGLVIVGFAVADLLPVSERYAVSPRYLPLGGILSGFFGGLSGTPGAFRSMFLLKAGLTKEAFIGTSVVAAVIVDAVRLFVYGASFNARTLATIRDAAGIIVVATLAGFAGAALGKRLIGKVTFRSIEVLVAIMLLGIGAGLAAGLI